jgi:hypothetical protein
MGEYRYCHHHHLHRHHYPVALRSSTDHLILGVSRSHSLPLRTTFGWTALF